MFCTVTWNRNADNVVDTWLRLGRMVSGQSTEAVAASVDGVS